MEAKWIETTYQECIMAMWEEPEYFTVTRRACSNCGKRSPGDGQYPYCPFCGRAMQNAGSEEYYGTNT